MPPKRQFGYKKRKLYGVKPGKRDLQNHFYISVAKAAA
jgi:hypothetical protein